MESLVHTVIETFAFRASAKQIGMTSDEIESITLFISQNPASGDIIKGTGGARKVRFPLGGKGKSKGCRVVTFFSGDKIPVFLLEVFSKTDRINLSKQERNELAKVLSGLADDYKESIKLKTQMIGKAS